MAIVLFNASLEESKKVPRKNTGSHHTDVHVNRVHHETGLQALFFLFLQVSTNVFIASSEEIWLVSPSLAYKSSSLLVARNILKLFAAMSGILNIDRVPQL